MMEIPLSKAQQPSKTGNMKIENQPPAVTLLNQTQTRNVIKAEKKKKLT
jgi:hypothetical protein